MMRKETQSIRPLAYRKRPLGKLRAAESLRNADEVCK